MRSWTGRASVIALSSLAVVAWVRAMNEAAQTLSFEPNSDSALHQAAAARLPALAWALVLAAAAVALARVSGYRWLALLGVPGLVVAVVLLLDPHGNGSALILGLGASVLSVGLTAFCAARARTH